MKRLIVLFVLVVVVLGVLGGYLYGGSTVPNGQPALVRLDKGNVFALKDSFNSAADSVRVIIMLSPT